MREQQQPPASHQIGGGRDQQRDEGGEPEIGNGQADLIFGNVQAGLDLRNRQAEDIHVIAGEQGRHAHQQENAFLPPGHRHGRTQARRQPAEIARERSRRSCALRCRNRSSAPCRM